MYFAAVLARASHLFLENGYGATSDASIYTGIASKGWFYTNFKEGKLDVAKAIMENSLSTEGLQPQPLVTQMIYDIGMLLAHKIKVEEEYLAALKLSFESSAKHYGHPWRQWVAFNAQQLTQAQENGEIMKHISPQAEARQIPASWSGQVQITLAVDEKLDDLHIHMNHVYRNWLGGMVNRRILAQLDLDPLRGERLYDEYVLGRDSHD
jgi:hypothetical protein